MTLPSNSIGIIGSADGPTSILVAGSFPWEAVAAVILVAAIVLGIWWTKRKK